MAPTPMFPLGVVLVPGAGLPLHVFEDRYRQMIVDVLAADGPAEFGVVLITRGTEVGGGDERAEVATIARILDAQVSPDGRYGLLTGGHRRVRVMAWRPDDPYPRADVEDWPDELDGDPDELVTHALKLRDRIAVLRERIAAGGVGDGATDEVRSDALDDDGLARAGAVMASYRLAAWTPMGPADALRALSVVGPAARLAVLDEVLDDLVAAADFREQAG